MTSNQLKVNNYPQVVYHPVMKAKPEGSPSSSEEKDEGMSKETKILLSLAGLAVVALGAYYGGKKGWFGDGFKKFCGGAGGAGDKAGSKAGDAANDAGKKAGDVADDANKKAGETSKTNDTPPVKTDGETPPVKTPDTNVAKSKVVKAEGKATLTAKDGKVYTADPGTGIITDKECKEVEDITSLITSDKDDEVSKYIQETLLVKKDASDTFKLGKSSDSFTGRGYYFDDVAKKYELRDFTDGKLTNAVYQNNGKVTSVYIQGKKISKDEYEKIVTEHLSSIGKNRDDVLTSIKNSKANKVTRINIIGDTVSKIESNAENGNIAFMPNIDSKTGELIFTRTVNVGSDTITQTLVHGSSKEILEFSPGKTVSIDWMNRTFDIKNGNNHYKVKYTEDGKIDSYSIPYLSFSKDKGIEMVCGYQVNDKDISYKLNDNSIIYTSRDKSQISILDPKTIKTQQQPYIFNSTKSIEGIHTKNVNGKNIEFKLEKDKNGKYVLTQNLRNGFVYQYSGIEIGQNQFGINIPLVTNPNSIRCYGPEKEKSVLSNAISSIGRAVHNLF